MGSTDGEVANPSVVEEEAKKIGGEQDERCKNGIQAIFAGFVAVSTAREVSQSLLQLHHQLFATRATLSEPILYHSPSICSLCTA